MKKTIIILSIIVVLFIGAILSIPLFFKKNLMEASKNTINKNFNAKIEFTDFKLSIFRNFPKATIALTDVTIVGENEFQTDTLLNVPLVTAKTSLASLFKKDGITIEEIIFEKPQLKLLVNDAGKANWEINEPALSKTANPEKENFNNEEQKKSFELNLEKIQINDAELFYLDKPAEIEMDLTDINFTVSGKMYGNEAKLLTEGEVQNFNLKYSGVDYILKTSMETKTALDVDYETMKFTFAENELLINKLALELSGYFEMPSDSMFFDLQIKTKESDFDNFLALVPPSYEEYLKDIKTTGSATVTGSIKGLYFDENYPSFSMKLNIANGNFQYVGLPEQIKNITADVAILKPQGVLNLTEINIKKAHAEIKNNPVDLTLRMNNLVKDPWFDGAFVGKINFDHLKDVLPLDSVNVAGIVDANLFVKGNYSAVEKEEYEKLKSDGIVLLDNFVYDSPELTQKIFVPKGHLDFSPSNINLQEFNVRVGQSDFNLSGKVFNYLNYLLKDGTLKGDLRLNSKLVNLNELLRLQKPKVLGSETTTLSDSKNTAEPESDNLAFTIPDNIDITFRSQIEQAIFDRLPISNINGLITAKNGKLILNGLKMKMLQGELSLNGSYRNTAQNQPLIDFGFDILNFDIPMAYQTLSGLRRMLPVAGHSEGKFSSTMEMKGQLSASHKLIPSSINGAGDFSTTSLQIIESPIFNQLKGILKPEKLKNVAVADFKANFMVENGNLELRPFKTKVAGQETTFRGTLSAENLINMRMDFNVQRDAFGTDIQKILAVIPGNQNIKVVPAGVIIEGPVGDPEVKMDLSETRTYITNATKDELQNTIDKLGKGLRKLFEK